MVPAQPVAQIVLGQQHFGDAREHLGLVFGHPHQLRRGEARHREIAGDPARVRNRGFERRALGARAPVVPEDGGPQHGTPRVEQRGAVLLPRKADRPNGGERRAVPGLQFVHGPARGDPPVFGILLRPQAPGRRDAERSRRLSGDAVIAVEQNRLHRRGAEVDAEIQPLPSPCPGVATRRRCFRLVLRIEFAIPASHCGEEACGNCVAGRGPNRATDWCQCIPSLEQRRATLPCWRSLDATRRSGPVARTAIHSSHM